MAASVLASLSRPTVAQAQGDALPNARASITAERVRASISVLAADSLEGRGAGYRGDSLAAAYIAGIFRRAGLAPAGDAAGPGRSYLQHFPLHPRRPTLPFQVLRSQNVLALLEGSDPVLKAEVVVVGAHYDGQGMTGQADMGRISPAVGTRDSVWNAANDNGSGVAALLTLAEALAAQQPRPHRSILFVAFGGEEHGLVGSLHYTANPAVAWERHVAMVNLEMIGWDPAQTLNVRGTATSPEWAALLELATTESGVQITTRQPELTSDTDHYGFGVRGIPAIHYGVGGSRHHYHAVTDEAERIAAAALAARTRHVLALTWRLANHSRRIPYSWKHPRDLGITGTTITAAEMSALALDGTQGGVKITAVAYGLPAQRAGVLAGDVILALNGRAIKRGEPGMRVLAEQVRSSEAGVDVPVVIARGGTRIEIGVRFEATDSARTGETTRAREPRLLGPADVNALPSAPPDHRVAYGADSLQFGELRLPAGPGPFPVVLLLHGGCWISHFANVRNTAALADALRRSGIATWNVEYRRADHPGGGWPGTFRDAAAAADHIRELARRFPLDTSRVVAVGHSAGGHLAFWLGARHKLPSRSAVSSPSPLRLAGVVSLGGPPDLATFAGPDARVCGAPVVERLMGGSPTGVPERFRLGSPAELLPLGVPQRLIVGTRDVVVPADAARAYASRAFRLGDDVRYIPVEAAGHHEVVAPTTAAWAVVQRVVLELTRPRDR
jgi:acetyl esterase/lipase/acetylornithine deacetylase/succinyl-diaminopimelate desuccinylase-like protein